MPSPSEASGGRCIFCRMDLAGAIDGLFFVIEEVLLFFVLVVVKHRIPSLLERFVQRP